MIHYHESTNTTSKGTKKLQTTIQTDSSCSINSLAFQPPKWAISACQKDTFRKEVGIEKSNNTAGNELKRPENANSVAITIEDKPETLKNPKFTKPNEPKNQLHKHKSGEFMDMFSPVTKVPNTKSVPDLKSIAKSDRKDNSDAVSAKSFGSRLQKTFHSKSHDSLNKLDTKSVADKQERAQDPKTPMEKSAATPSENRLFTRGSIYRSGHIPTTDSHSKSELDGKTPIDLHTKTPMGILKRSGDLKEVGHEDDLTKFNEKFSSLSQKVLSDTMVRVSDEISPMSFQYKLIRNVVDEVLKENLSAIHRDIQNMHLELIKQFQNQKVLVFNQIEIEMLIQEKFPNQGILDLVDDLRMENERLRNNRF
ncbi:hypothetical protein HDV01_002379 [Terramyces sp. JEL0728]|nr:hypothetical protein HDV01_002379 [Terramyces sp. JEL0728]